MNARTPSIAAIVMVVLGLCSPVAADAGFAQRGQFVVSGDRLFGVVRGHTQETNGNEQTVTNYTGVSLLASPLSQVASHFASPRIAFDYLPINGLTLGLSAGYFNVALGLRDSFQGRSMSIDGPSVSGFMLVPRVGYAYMLTRSVGIWPRAGLTYLHVSETLSNSALNGTSTLKVSLNELALTLEAALALVPIEHVGFWIGPVLDVGLSGNQTQTQPSPAVGGSPSNETKTRTTEYGLQAGIFVYL